MTNFSVLSLKKNLKEFLKDFLEGTSIIDFAVLLCISLFLSLMFFLIPPELKSILMFNRDNFYVW